jgi:cysteine desulfurase
MIIIPIEILGNVCIIENVDEAFNFRTTERRMNDMKQTIYLDNAATTKTNPEVVQTMLPYFTEFYGNPSSVYEFSNESKKAITSARETIANAIGAKTNEIYFTAGGSESDNWALIATAEAYATKGKHIITSKIEHHAVLHTCEYLEKKGFEVTYLNVDENGVIKLEELKKAIRQDTILISIMFANNEIGTIEPIKEIGEVAKEHGVFFHTDAVQAFGHVPINVDEYNIDMLSASGHKIYGPKGIGFLYIRKGMKSKSFIHGGAQERKRRAGTENVPAIAGFGKAVEIALADMEKNTRKETELREYLMKRVLAEVPYSRINGHRKNRLPNNVNFAFQFIEGESLLIMLDMKGICGSSGSACTSGSLDPSHVLLAIGLPHEIAHGSLRLTLSPENTKEEMDVVVDSIKEIVEKLRNMSPLYEDFLRKENK